mmetsp:Transcript_16263/g.38245  ORF Transcript_16263/g.38245 Transcript_16263/m.38245 type:complete len:206 (-) Transcript_16263:1271-1888(-)
MLLLQRSFLRRLHSLDNVLELRLLLNALVVLVGLYRPHLLARALEVLRQCVHGLVHLLKQLLVVFLEDLDLLLVPLGLLRNAVLGLVPVLAQVVVRCLRLLPLVVQLCPELHLRRRETLSQLPELEAALAQLLLEVPDLAPVLLGQKRRDSNLIHALRSAVLNGRQGGLLLLCCGLDQGVRLVAAGVGRGGLLVVVVHRRQRRGA